MELRGVPIASGCALGRAKVKGRKRERMESCAGEPSPLSRDERRREGERFDRALRQAKAAAADTYQRALGVLPEKEAEIFLVHLGMLEDPELSEQVMRKIAEEGCLAEQAVSQVLDTYAGLFDQIEEEYLRARKQDVYEAEELLLDALSADGRSRETGEEYGEILVVPELMAKDLLSEEAFGWAGVAAERGGETAHASILCRCMAIPFVCGVEGLPDQVADGDFLVVDGDRGLVLVNPNQEQTDAYRQRRKCQEQRVEELRRASSLPSVTADGVKIRLHGNVAGLPEARLVLENGAEGIGLFRTEFLFMENDHIPAEEEQYAVYRQMAELAEGRPVTIRTLDIGGDKQVKHMELPTEANPFLGVRGVRYCLDNRRLFQDQLRAILRASTAGRLRIMVPMVSTLAEVSAVKEMLAQVKAGLREERCPFDESIPLGIMIEVPAAAILADQFFREVDFVSVGTNDLCQYLMAADRTNPQVKHLYRDTDPALLRILSHIFTAGQQAGKEFGVCGEMAGKPRMTPLLMGMGLREFSMGASALLTVRQRVRSCVAEECRALARKALCCGSAEEVERLLASDSKENGADPGSGSFQ